MVQLLPSLHYQAGCKKGSPQPNKPTRIEGQGTREHGKKGKKEPRQAHKKKGYPPPIWQGAGSPSPHHKFASKNQQKVAWVDMKKFSEKFFGGMFRGKEKPLALSQRKGRLTNLTNENREISNLAMQVNQKRTKALITECKGM